MAFQAIAGGNSTHISFNGVTDFPINHPKTFSYRRGFDPYYAFSCGSRSSPIS